MTVRVLLFGHYREAAPVSAGSDSIFTVDIPDGSTVTALAGALSALDARLEDILVRTRAAVGTEFARADTVLFPGDEVAFLPPMSGG